MSLPFASKRSRTLWSSTRSTRKKKKSKDASSNYKTTFSTIVAARAKPKLVWTTSLSSIGHLWSRLPFRSSPVLKRSRASSRWLKWSILTTGFQWTSSAQDLGKLTSKNKSKYLTFVCITPFSPMTIEKAPHRKPTIRILPRYSLNRCPLWPLSLKHR